MMLRQIRYKPSLGFLGTLGVLLVVATTAKPVLRWARAQYDIYKTNTTILVASDTEYQRLLSLIQAQQPGHQLEQPIPKEAAISEQIFQAAIAPDLLGRSSRYEPNTSGGKLACARMVNRVIQKALGYQIGENPLFVPSMVQDLDRGIGQRLLQSQTKRGDLAISNGTDYEQGLWHIGICANDGCSLILSNSPFSSRFDWLTGPNFDGAFDQYPGETTFYRVVKPVS